jgi:hypothetical protein
MSENNDLNLENLVNLLFEKIKNEIIEEIGKANKEEIKEIVFDLRVDMEDIINKRVKSNMSLLFEKLSSVLKEDN